MQLALRFVAHAVRHWPSMVAIAHNWPIWILRQLLRPIVPVRCWIRTRAGSRIYLGADPIDDAVLRHVMHDAVDLYFPAGAQIPAGAVVVDVGAHHGIYATEVLRRNDCARLIAIEPHPEARGFFERNLRANRMLDRVEYVEAGLSNRTGSGSLTIGARSWDHSTLPGPSADSRHAMAVTVTRLVDILAGRQPYLIKLNAEGAEFEVIPDLLDNGIRPEWLILMVHPGCGSIVELMRRIAQAGYDVQPADGRSDSTRFHCRLRRTGARIASSP